MNLDELDRESLMYKSLLTSIKDSCCAGYGKPANHCQGLAASGPRPRPSFLKRQVLCICQAKLPSGLNAVLHNVCFSIMNVSSILVFKQEFK